ncbi:matrixin family metalloprotease [Candidatus Woesearchaeota archaeon]|nr:matrixin family metalloprotease [Candidatus Woesearchaeota archaeon]
MRKYLPWLFGAFLFLESCAYRSIDVKPRMEEVKERSFVPSKGAEDLGTLNMRLYFDEEVSEGKKFFLQRVVEEATEILSLYASASERLRGKKFKIAFSSGGEWDSEDEVDDSWALLNEFLHEKSPEGELSLAFSGQEFERVLGHASRIPGKAVILTTKTSKGVLRNALLHEIGHALGLYHTADRDSIMYHVGDFQLGVFNDTEIEIIGDNISSLLNFKMIKKKVKAPDARTFEFPLLGIVEEVPDYYLAAAVPYPSELGSRFRVSMKASGSFQIELEYLFEKKKGIEKKKVLDHFLRFKEEAGRLGASGLEDIIFYAGIPDYKKMDLEYHLLSQIINFSPGYFMRHASEIIGLSVKYGFVAPEKAEVLKAAVVIAEKSKVNPFQILYQLD